MTFNKGVAALPVLLKAERSHRGRSLLITMHWLSIGAFIGKALRFLMSLPKRVGNVSSVIAGKLPTTVFSEGMVAHIVPV
jgi:hypothetical protein